MSGRTRTSSDTRWACFPQRYADPDKHPVLGVLYRVGENEPDEGKKVKCLIHLTPAYDARQPRYGQEALFAKAGYAVGGLNVKTKKIVTAVQVVFMKQKPDGTLSYRPTATPANGSVTRTRARRRGR